MTLDFTGGSGLRYAVSIDDGQPTVVNAQAGETQARWAEWVSDDANVQATRCSIAAPGPHTVKIWSIDPGLVFERVVLATRPLPRSYLGPPESRIAPERRVAVDR